MALIKVEGGGGVGGSDRSWRDSAIRSRLSYALEQEGFQKDVTFIVGGGDGGPPQITSAHRLILSLSSEYFDKLMREGGGGFISLPKVCPIMFKRLLKYIYTDEIENENFFQFLDFAKTFGFHHLHDLCLENWLKVGITVENVIFILGLERRWNREGGDYPGRDTGLGNKCLEFIKRNADKVVRLDSFNEISQQDLVLILGSDDFILEGGEFSVFLLALRWAKYQCRIGGGGVVGGESPENLRIVLGDVRFKIRFTLIPYPKLLLEVKSSGLLSSTEFVQVLKTFIDPTENPLGISTHPRRLRHCNGHGSPGQIKNGNEHYEPEPKRKRSTETSVGHTPQTPRVPALYSPSRPLSPDADDDLDIESGVSSSRNTVFDDVSTSTSSHDSLVHTALANTTLSPSSARLRLQGKVPNATTVPTQIGLNPQVDSIPQYFKPEPYAHEILPHRPEHPSVLPFVLDSTSTPVTPTPNPSISESDNLVQQEEESYRADIKTIRLRVPPPPPSLSLSSSTLTEFLRSNTTLNWGQLLSATKEKKSTLTRIVLTNTAVSGFKRGHGGRVVLRELKTFHYSQDRHRENTTPNPTLPDTTHPYFMNMESFLFFDKSSRSRWRFSELPNIGVDIRISVKGINLMTISPTEKKIILSYPPSKEGDRILENCPSDTKILSLCCAEIKSPEQIPIDSLEQLNLYNVEIHGTTVTRLINQCPHLKHISLYQYSPPPSTIHPYYRSQIFLISDFKNCRSNLKSLSLTKDRLSGLSPKCVDKFVPFSALESLYLNCCAWNPHFPEQFGISFPKLKRFGIRWIWKDKALTATLLKNVLEQAEGLEFVSISLQINHDDDDDAVESGADEYNLYPTEEEGWMQNFLVKATPTALDISATPCGYVEEDLLAQNIVLRKTNGVWRRSRSGNDDVAADKIHFKALKLDHFFEDVEMLKFL